MVGQEVQAAPTAKGQANRAIGNRPGVVLDLLANLAAAQAVEAAGLEGRRTTISQRTYIAS